MCGPPSPSSLAACRGGGGGSDGGNVEERPKISEQLPLQYPPCRSHSGSMLVTEAQDSVNDSFTSLSQDSTYGTHAQKSLPIYTPSKPRKAVKNNVQCDEHVGLLHRGIWQRVATVEVPEPVSQLAVEARRRAWLARSAATPRQRGDRMHSTCGTEQRKEVLYRDTGENSREAKKKKVEQKRDTEHLSC